jgi:hypothetical protein
MLPQFIGTEHYHQWSILFQRMYLSDGAKYVADSCGAYWLMDIIASTQHLKVMKENAEFQVWRLRYIESSHSWQVTCTDGGRFHGNNALLYKQNIPYSDFPLPEGVEIWVEQNVLLLPSEH